MTRRPLLTSLLTGLALLCGSAACTSSESDAQSSDLRQLPYAEGSPQALAVLALVNDQAKVDFRAIDVDARLDWRAAQALIAHRDGPDGSVRSADDDLFDSLAELATVKRVKGRAIRKLLVLARTRGYLDRQLAKRNEVIFSPQPYERSHLQRVAQEIARAEHTIDIAMYSYSDGHIADALRSAVAQGVRVRFIFETARKDQRADESEIAATKSGRLELLGADVRYVNKIMHHKFMIVDGPTDTADAAHTATVLTGSGNWSHSAGTRYDENTLVMTGYPELSMRLQREFNHLWAHSRDLQVELERPHVLSELEITDELLPENPGLSAIFTSDNFTLSADTTFRVTDTSTVADALVDAIGQAETSIHIASGHLRSRPIAEALKERLAETPELDVKILLDGQEYISARKNGEQRLKLETCLSEAGESESRRRACSNKGYYFSYEMGEAGAEVRYKYYAYHWHYTYAEQMHHKFLLIDDQLFTGSYNLSDNAEHNTFENMVHLKGPEFAPLVARYRQNFEHMWTLNRAQDAALIRLRDQVANGRQVPLVFRPMALEWQQVTALKALIYSNCPALGTDSDYWRNPGAHQSCPR